MWKWMWNSLSQSDSLRPHGLYSPWNSPGQNTGVGSLYLLQGISRTQELNSTLPPCRWILYQLNHMENPRNWYACPKWQLNIRITSWYPLPSFVGVLCICFLKVTHIWRNGGGVQLQDRKKKKRKKVAWLQLSFVNSRSVCVWKLKVHKLA